MSNTTTNTTARFDHQSCGRYDSELSVDFAAEVGFDLHRTAFHLYDAIQEAGADKQRMLALLHLLGSQWLDILGQLDEALRHWRANLSQLL